MTRRATFTAAELRRALRVAAYRRSEWVLAYAAGILIAARSQSLFPTPCR